MAVLLLILGIVVAACGVAAIGFGIPLNEFTVGTTLMAGGATALTGGFILIGLSAVVTELSRLADAIRGGAPARAARGADPMLAPAVPTPNFPATAVPPPVAVSSPRPAGPNIPARPRPEPATRPQSTQQPSSSSVDVSAAAIERLRSTIPRAEPAVGRSEGARVEPGVSSQADEEATLSPNGPAQYVPAPRNRPDALTTEPKVAPGDRAAAAVETLKSSRLDFLFRSKPAGPAPEPPNFEAIWPAEARAARAPRTAEAVQRTAEPVPEAPPASAAPAPGLEAPSQGAPVPPSQGAPVSVLKSGVVDGMAYTLYTDGSIEAKLPEGTVRFASVAELRTHIESHA